jgi:hypothetical protein
LKHLPSQRPQRVTAVDGHQGKKKQERIRSANGMQKFPPAKMLVPEETAREVNNQTQQQQPNQYDKNLP